MEIQRFSYKLCHHGEDKSRSFAKKLGYRLNSKVINYNICALVNAQAKPIPKSTKIKTEEMEERMRLDISDPFP